MSITARLSVYMGGLIEIVNIYDISIHNVKLLPHPVYIVIWEHESPAASQNIKERETVRSNKLTKVSQVGHCIQSGAVVFFSGKLLMNNQSNKMIPTRGRPLKLINEAQGEH